MGGVKGKELREAQLLFKPAKEHKLYVHMSTIETSVFTTSSERFQLQSLALSSFAYLRETKSRDTERMSETREPHVKFNFTLASWLLHLYHQLGM